MTKNVKNIDINETVYDACKMYSELKVGSLVVMDKDMIVGIVTERDIIERIILANKNPKTTKIQDIMSHNIKTIHATASIEKAAMIIRNRLIRLLDKLAFDDIELVGRGDVSPHNFGKMDTDDGFVYASGASLYVEYLPEI